MGMRHRRLLNTKTSYGEVGQSNLYKSTAKNENVGDKC